MTQDAALLQPLSFAEELRQQRWDDHRFYHQSYVNQSLHLVSACCFLATYVLIPINPVAAAFFGWVIAMWSRQIGHFFFEPTGYDQINDVSFERKEAIKVGFNLQRKVILFAAWIAVPAALYLVPGALAAASRLTHTTDFAHNLAVIWLWLAAAGLLGRTIFLCLTRNLQTGVVWFTKILTDPFHDIKMYHRAPLHLLRGERLDPMDHVRDHR
jgi:hypothetical protein